jgi:hypothetical protein
MLKSLIVLGVELGPYVINWAQIEQVKEVLLARTTLFTGELEINLSNARGQFSPEKRGSLFFGKNLFNIDAVIRVDGRVAFQGLLKDPKVNHGDRTVTLVMQNIMSKPADSILPALTISAGNPASVMLEAMALGGLLDLVDVGSFLAAGAPSREAGAVIDVNIAAGSNVSVLNLLQQISDLASISVFVNAGLIQAKAVTTYPGGESGLRQELNADVVRDFKERNTASDNFNNEVVVYYGGSQESYTARDERSIGITKITRTLPFATLTGSLVAVPDLASAVYFAATALARASTPPVVVTLEVGKEFIQANIGDRFPVTASNWGMVRKPFELIEKHLSLMSESVDMTLRSI